ncbi:MAG: hypothetical protein ACREYE_30035, partial [Gammaproteobacteria bacterium]
DLSGGSSPEACAFIVTRFFTSRLCVAGSTSFAREVGFANRLPNTTRGNKKGQKGQVIILPFWLAKSYGFFFSL